MTTRNLQRTFGESKKNDNRRDKKGRDEGARDIIADSDLTGHFVANDTEGRQLSSSENDHFRNDQLDNLELPAEYDAGRVFPPPSPFPPLTRTTSTRTSGISKRD